MKNNLVKALFPALAILALTASLAVAHGNEKHVVGTVKAITENSITVETPAKTEETVKVTPQTSFIKSGAAATLHDLKTGNRVVIHAKPVDGGLEATEVKFGATKPEAKKP